MNDDKPVAIEVISGEQAASLAALMERLRPIVAELGARVQEIQRLAAAPLMELSDRVAAITRAVTAAVPVEVEARIVEKED